jgi:hypothetical protein
LRCGFAQFELCADFLDLRGLLFQLGHQHFHPFLLPLNGGFLFGDPLLLFERFVEYGLGLERHPVPVGIDGYCAYLLIAIDQHKLGAARINLPTDDGDDKAIIISEGGVPMRRNRISSPGPCASAPI